MFRLCFRFWYPRVSVIANILLRFGLLWTLILVFKVRSPTFFKMFRLLSNICMLKFVWERLSSFVKTVFRFWFEPRNIRFSFLFSIFIGWRLKASDHLTLFCLVVDSDSMFEIRFSSFCRSWLRIGYELELWASSDYYHTWYAARTYKRRRILRTRTILHVSLHEEHFPPHVWLF